jgi:hypothetical protein
MLRAVISFCPRCGAQFRFDLGIELARTEVRCRDCRLAVTEVPQMLAPSEDDIGYELEDWPVTVRAPATAALVEMGIPYRWEEGLVLVVPASAEEEVDRLLDQLEAEEVFHFPGEEELEAEGEDGGEEAQAAMSDLFVAADRFQNSPFDDRAIRVMEESAARVADCLPPYGIERPVWSRIQELAGIVASGLEKAEDFDAVAEDARALRAFLREYV